MTPYEEAVARLGGIDAWRWAEDGVSVEALTPSGWILYSSVENVEEELAELLAAKVPEQTTEW